MYWVQVYADVEDTEPIKIKEADEAMHAMMVAMREASSLSRETKDFEFGHAGEDELFELFPKIGAGTVVVTTAVKN